MRSWIARRTLRAFAKRYGYDVSYLLMMLNHSPAAFFKFAPLMKAAAHREAVPIDASFAAKIVGALAEDCGPCTQLVVDMALEAGMAKDQIEAVLRRDVRAMNEATTLWIPVRRRRGAPGRRGGGRISRRRPGPMGPERRDRSDAGAANGPHVPDGEGGARLCQGVPTRRRGWK